MSGAKRRKEEEQEEEEEEESATICAVCLEPWTTQGNHQICSLGCGHFFGLSCVERILAMGGKQCPNCRKEFRRAHIRTHFVAASLLARDSTREENLARQVAEERALRIAAEMSHGKSKARVEQLELQIAQMRQSSHPRPPPLQSGGGGGGDSQSDIAAAVIPPSPSSNSSSIKTTVIAVPMNRARAACWISPERGAVVAAAAAAAAATGCEDYVLCNVHPDFPDRKTASCTVSSRTRINDLALSTTNAVSYGGCLAVASLDNQVRLFTAQNLTSVCSFALPEREQAWSVCFLADGRTLLAGGLQGRVYALDARMPREPVKLVEAGDIAAAMGPPVHSICSLGDGERALVATFSSLRVLDCEGGAAFTLSPLGGVRERAKAAQYVSLAASGGGGEDVAIAVRGAGNVSSIETGRISDLSFASSHVLPDTRAVGRIALLRDCVLVPCADACYAWSREETPALTRLATRHTANIAGVYACTSTSLAMLLAPDVVEFFPL